ncbi:MAG: acetyl-CoA carboxylase carboxyl transferase subunit beta [Actinobacteria bacterium]|nr:acetyl-CoA carboxylase carboxyl transferase subunit beta [Actinomycetota bacterium]
MRRLGHGMAERGRGAGTASLRERARGLWTRCGGCGLEVERAVLETALGVCPHCGYHHRMGVGDRVAYLFDPGSFLADTDEVRTSDPISFQEGAYLREALSLTGEAMLFGEAAVLGKPCVAALMDFSVFGGSMGIAVGELFRRACARSVERGYPLLAVACSGGARVQEGTPALLQMARVMFALAQLSEARLPFISLLCDPTSGGVAASFATAADVILAEPGALICFSGPRVVEQTLGIKPRPDFSRAESLLERGLVDMVVPRRRQREVIGGLLAFFERR